MDILAERRRQEPCSICKYKKYEHLVAVRTDNKDMKFRKMYQYSRQQLQNEINSHTIMCTWCFRIYMSNVYFKPFPTQFDASKPCCGRLCNIERKFYNHYQLCPDCHEHHTQLKNQRHDFVNAYKRSFKCCPTCKTKIQKGNEMCFDLDHRNPYDKEHNISHLIRKLAPLTVIQHEMQKCRILCCFCHIDHTKTQQHIFQRKDFKKRRKTLRKHGKFKKGFVQWDSDTSSDCEPEPIIRSTYNPLNDPPRNYPIPPLSK